MVVWCELCGEKRANYKEKGRGKPLKYCVDCKEEGMIKADVRICTEEGCSKRPAFNFEGELRGKFCSYHKKESMIDVLHKICEEKGCRTRPVFNFRGLKPKYCTEHKLENMIDVSSRKCVHENCTKIPSFNFEGKSASFCSSHKEHGMVDVKSAKCAHKNCRKGPSYNFEGDTVLFCTVHKKEGMVNVKTKKCDRLGCKIISRYNFPGETESKFCSKHKEYGMINVKNKKICAQKDCEKHPSFNFEGLSGKYCVSHKKENMVNVVNKTCKYQDCRKQPRFNFEGLPKEFCSEHKKKDMVNVSDKICQKTGCKSRASYGLLFSTKTHCAKHATANMVSRDMIHPKCQYSLDDEPCTNQPLFAASGDIYPIFCEDHEPGDYVNIIEKECEECRTPFYIPDDQTKCARCRNVNLREQFEKSRELRIKTVLEARGFLIESHDKIVDGACSQKRPDFVIGNGLFKIVIEVDEGQHKHIPDTCDLIRMAILHQDFGENVVFIRYNPDTYTNRSGKEVKGFKENQKREKRLVALIRQLLRRKKPLEYNLAAYYLFFDGDNGTDILIDLDYYDCLRKDDYTPLARRVRAARLGEALWEDDCDEETEEE